MNKLKIKWEDFNSGASKTEVCFRVIVGHSGGSNEFYCKKHFICAVKPDIEGYSMILNGNIDTKKQTSAQTLEEAKMAALRYLSTDIQEQVYNLFLNAKQTSESAGF